MRMRRKVRMLATTGAAVSIVAVAAVPAAAQAVPPDEWAETICSDAVDWAEALGEAGQAFDEAETPAEATDALDGAIDDTSTAVRQLRRAGRPDVDGGKASARAFVAIFRDARGILEDARDEAADLPEGADAFDEGRTAIDDGLDEDFTALDPDIQAVRSDADPALQDALDEDSSCREIFGSGSDDGESDDT